MSSPANPSGRRVMLVDDSNTIRSSAARYLTQAGCEVIMADDGLTRWQNFGVDRT
jgi:twitching motility two-component system response regulator PilG